MANDSDVNYEIHFPGSYTGSPDVVLNQMAVREHSMLCTCTVVRIVGEDILGYTCIAVHPFNQTSFCLGEKQGTLC